MRLCYLIGCVWLLATQIANAQSLSDHYAHEPIQSALSNVRNTLDSIERNKDLDDNGLEVAASIRLLLDFDLKGRHRYLLPRGLTNSRASIEQLAKYTNNPQGQSALQRSFEELAESLETRAKVAEAENDLWAGYCLRWNAIGMRSVIPRAADRKASPLSTWEPAAALNQVRMTSRAQQNHPQVLWPAGSYSLATTPNFEIASQAGAKPTTELAELCEQTLAIWQQMFFPVWTDKQISAPEYSSARQKKFSVVLFRDKAAYVQALKGLQSNISISTGYYDPSRRVAFFFWDGPKTAPTVVHELTHQFFFEANNQEVRMDTDNDSGFWVAEGLALYTESMSQRSCGGATIVDVGGWDSPRLQAGKYRFHQSTPFWIPWNRFSEANGRLFRETKEISAWYSQACGLAHVWMDGDHSSQNEFIQYVQSVYGGKSDASLLGALNDDAKLRDTYDEQSRRGPIENPNRPYFANRRELVLTKSEVTSQNLLNWPKEFRSQAWLDLSWTLVDDELFGTDEKPVLPAWNITRLSLEATKITDHSIKAIAAMKDLNELDLSGCGISDDGIEQLNGNKSIKKLWLSQTPVSDASIDIFLSMSQLDSIHLAGTKVSQAAWQRLLQARPRLKSNSTAP